ncbi:MAG: T9SS type A sorting domain-containing protein [Bacteroidales bacterium]|nr:T9SS type A sorting domain-containing protein [Bacteroidales bacterium]
MEVSNFTKKINPLESNSIIKYAILCKSPVTIKILDLTGQEIVMLVNENQQKGQQQIVFDTGNLPAGIYFCVLKTRNGIQTKKIIKL